eukprot:45377_1
MFTRIGRGFKYGQNISNINVSNITHHMSFVNHILLRSLTSESNHNENIQKEFSSQSNNFFEFNKKASIDLLQPLIDSAKIIHSTLDNAEQCNILDIACGPGLISLECAQQLVPCKKIIGIDITTDMLNIAKSHATNNGFKIGANDDCILDYIHGNVEELPFENNTFDIVITRWTFHHFNQLDKILKEIYRVLNEENGTLVFMELNAPNEPVKLEKIYNAIETIRDPTHTWAYTKYGWMQKLIDAGFKEQKIKTYKEFFGPSRDFMKWITQTSASERESLYVLCEELYENGIDTGFNLSRNENNDLVMRHPYIIMAAEK